ncbi:MAG: hypothetical protein WCT31_02050 [Candidatus Micrarchaeia archaeon]|jgi:hypothetical protein
MIVGGKIDEVDAKKMKEENISGLNINIVMEDVKVKGEDVEMKYVYTVDYEDKVGVMKITGYLYAKEDKKLVKEIEDSWKKNKKLPEKYAETILNAINYSGSANGTLVARVINLSPPLIPPRIRLGKQE